MQIWPDKTLPGFVSRGRFLCIQDFDEAASLWDRVVGRLLVLIALTGLGPGKQLAQTFLWSWLMSESFEMLAGQDQWLQCT
ncbi:hypothetical protein AFA_12620 [Alcaligenes faecalis]|uniref:Uncharacterized protein n=1 Tax=Alcaligenes faecalis TaxID=511 RepID=A0AB33CUJ9_ALCFA|nr:hypothetical protein AFA_12620 [Alcaligenes faecalis]